jgi:hypothetical protein
MPTSGMLRSVALVRTDVSEELSASIIRVTRIGELGTTFLGDAILQNSYFFSPIVIDASTGCPYVNTLYKEILNAFGEGRRVCVRWPGTCFCVLLTVLWKTRMARKLKSVTHSKEGNFLFGYAVVITDKANRFISTYFLSDEETQAKGIRFDYLFETSCRFP